MIGYACKYMDINMNKEHISNMNFKTSTIKYLNKIDNQERKLLSLVTHNLNALENQILYVKSLNKELHMMRIGSDILPFFTHNDFSYFYKQDIIKNLIEIKLKEIGKLANGIRLSFHPGQFTVLASDRDDVIINSIKEIEYHTYIAKCLNYTDRSKMKINIHLSGKLGINKFKESFNSLSILSKNLLTVENTEYKYGLDEVLELSELLPIVFDIHHDFVFSEKYINISDNRINKIIKSWNGVKPVMHYSQPKITDTLKKKDLRKHSDYYLDNKVNDYVFKNFYNNFDIMCESKCKNLASIDLFNYLNKVI